MRLRSTVRSSKTILIVDDDEEYVRSTVRILEREGHDAHTAASGPEALEYLRTHQVDLVLIDYFMPGMTGEQVVRELRTFDAHVQVILQTGYASERPPREMLARLDIQGYHDKSEGPDKLLLWVDVGLRAASRVQLLQRSRAGLAYILGVTAELHKVQPLEQLLQGILTQTIGLLGAVAGSDGLVAVPHEGALRVAAATGRFAGMDRLDGPCDADALGGGTVLPLAIGEATLGWVFVQGACAREEDREILAVFANQAAVAIQNVSLHELAAVDPLTRAYTRRFFGESLVRALKGAQRTGDRIAVILVDLDDMKTINDRGGHLCGDQALAAIGAILRRSTRVTDIVGRYGGDEFAIVLGGTTEQGVEIVMQRIVDACAGVEIDAGGGSTFPVRVTVGGAIVPSTDAPDRTAHTHAFFESLAHRLVSGADACLYLGKSAGKGRSGGALTLEWQ